jgi:hypothetical protein
MMVSDSWVSRIQAARRLGQETRKPAPEYSRPYDTSFRTGSEWRD